MTTTHHLSGSLPPSAPSRRIGVAFVGLGERGRTTLQLMLPVESAGIVALCDLSESNVSQARLLLPEDSEPECVHGADAYQKVCRMEAVELVYICTDWTSHPHIAVEAMRQGKDVAIEVPAATTLEEVHLLLSTARETRRHCFLLENACFEQQTMEAIEAIHRGDIGEVVHAEGNYYHCLDDRWTTWRLEMNRQRRGDLYPTHELGPICQAMGIGKTDTLETLVCIDTGAFSGPQQYKNHTGAEAQDFQNGDHTTTLLRTRRGRTILLRHDVMTSQPYDRRLLFIGTRGRIELHDTGRPSHQEMTLAMNRRLIAALAGGRPFGIDINDLATWCAVIPLSEESIARGFAPVRFPDFYGIEPLSSTQAL